MSQRKCTEVHIFYETRLNKLVYLCEFHPSDDALVHIACADSNILVSRQEVYAVSESFEHLRCPILRFEETLDCSEMTQAF